MTYQFAAGWDNQSNLVDLVVQPRSEGISWPLMRTAADGLTYFDGMPECTLYFSVITKTQFDALVEQFGFSDTVKSVKATMRLPRNQDRAAGVYNVFVDYPKIENTRYRYWWSDLRITVRIVKALNSGDLY